MEKEKKVEMSRSELVALTLVMLAQYMELLHFDEGFAEAEAELIAHLDNHFGKGLFWRQGLAEANKTLAEQVVDAILLIKPDVEATNESANERR